MIRKSSRPSLSQSSLPPSRHRRRLAPIAPCLQLLKARSNRATKRINATDRQPSSENKRTALRAGLLQENEVEEDGGAEGRGGGRGGWGGGRKKRVSLFTSVPGKWVKRQVERAANLNHRQFCAVQFDSARSFRNLPLLLPFSLSPSLFRLSLTVSDS